MGLSLPRKPQFTHWIGSGAAARICGISKPTLIQRVKDGIYPIRWRDTADGYKYDVVEIIRVAYPTADDEQVTTLLKSFRDEGGKIW